MWNKLRQHKSVVHELLGIMHLDHNRNPDMKWQWQEKKDICDEGTGGVQ